MSRKNRAKNRAANASLTAAGCAFIAGVTVLAGVSIMFAISNENLRADAAYWRALDRVPVVVTKDGDNEQTTPTKGTDDPSEGIDITEVSDNSSNTDKDLSSVTDDSDTDSDSSVGEQGASDSSDTDSSSNIDDSSGVDSSSNIDTSSQDDSSVPEKTVRDKGKPDLDKNVNWDGEGDIDLRNVYMNRDKTTVYYLIQWGDCLYYISHRFGFDMYELGRYNEIANLDLIYAGDDLEFPHDETFVSYVKEHLYGIKPEKKTDSSSSSEPDIINEDDSDLDLTDVSIH